MTPSHKDNYFIDEDGYKMVDRLALYSDQAGECFICLGKTHRLDTVFGTFFCDSDDCNTWIEEDLQESAKKFDQDGLRHFG